MENMNKELQEKLQAPKCISHYYENWELNRKGCLFYDGHNLCILEASYRKSDTDVISAIHHEERVACTYPENIIIYGSNICAVFAYAQDYFLQYGAKALYNNKELENFCNFSFRNATHMLLEDWKKILTHLATFSHAHNDCFGNALDFTKNYLYSYWQRQSLIQDVHDIWIRFEGCATIANQKNNVVLKSQPPFFYCDKDEIKVTPTNSEILSLAYNRFYFYSLYSLTDWEIEEYGDIEGDYHLELMGVTACLAAKAIDACELRKDHSFRCSHAYQEMNVPQDNLQSLDYIDFLFNWKKNPYVFSDTPQSPNYLQYISFTLNGDKNKIYELYSKLILPIWRYTAKHSPDVPGIFTSDQMICSFLLVTEKKMLDYSAKSDFWATLEEPQQKALRGYAEGYFIYLRNTFHADENVFYQALEANGLSFDDVFPDFPSSADSSSITSSDWTAVNLWLLNEKEVPAHYLEDFHNFHTIMNRYIRDKEKLETILAYLLRCDGHFLRLPRKLSGKSKGVLDQKAVRKALVAIGIRNCSTSNISKALQALS